MKRLENRVAIVTGAAQGIGRSIAIGMAKEGAAIIIADINHSKALEVEAVITTLGHRGLAFETNVSSEASVNALLARTLAEFDRVDILVNNAGIFPTAPIEEMSESEWDQVIGTNLLGTFLCSKAVIPTFQKRKKGRIISITSGRAFQGAKNGAHYAASKAGIIGFTRALALETAQDGITVNAICPGVTDTAQPRGHTSEQDLYAQGKRIPLGRIGQPEDLVGPAIFLASDAAAYVTGQTLVVNGGGIMI